MTSPRRGGYLLIELLVTMGLTTAVITLLAAWLTTAMRNQRAAGEHLLRVNVQERLARQFRQDVHAARSILPLNLDADPDLRLRLAFEGHEVRYVRMNRHWERLEQVGDEVRRHEQYQLPPDQVRFESDEGAPQSTITMLLGQHPLRIEAVLGSDRRFERVDE